MQEHMFPLLDAFIRDIEDVAADKPDPLAIMSLVLKMVIDSEADPYLLTGALVEGITATIAKKIPPERRGEVALGAVRLLRDRILDCDLL
jgi:hypothetical protein